MSSRRPKLSRTAPSDNGHNSSQDKIKPSAQDGSIAKKTKKDKSFPDELSVRLRKGEDGAFKVLAPGTPWDEIDLSETFLQHDHHTTKKHPFFLTRRVLFPFGILLGALLTYSFAAPPDLMANFPEILSNFPEMDFGLPTNENWSDWIPTSFSGQDGLGGLLSNLTGGLNGITSWMESRDFVIGNELREQGYQAVHPVILVPGIVSTGLESWSTTPENKGWFRSRVWGSTTMIRAVLRDKEKWVQALMLDPETGLDPPGQKVRAAQGFDAASQFIQGYWVWAKIIENLAPLNYDSNNLELAAYDWRLSYYNLESRDAFFSRLKSKCELFKKTQGKKVVLVGHSMGSTIVLYFLKWVEAEGHGGGGPNWVEEHIESFISIAGPMLGVTKAMTAFLSGEMRDTVEVNPAASYMLEKFFSRKERATLFRAWAGSASMWVKGGSAIWGDESGAPDDIENATESHGKFLTFRHMHTATDIDKLDETEISPNLTMSEASAYVIQHSPLSFQKMMGTNYSYQFESDVDKLEANGQDHTKWTNPLEFQLPRAPSMKILCLYGHGKETERSYWYQKGPYGVDEVASEGSLVPSDDLTGTNMSARADFPSSRDNFIDTQVTADSSVPKIRSGVKFGEGDGTVSLLSLGTMCVEGWKHPEWNPAGIKVITREQKHEPEALDLRGGATTGEHIDILGSSMVNECVGKVAAGAGHELEDLFVSDIKKYTSRMKWPSL